jgi:hypothetical protein
MEKNEGLQYYLPIHQKKKVNMLPPSKAHRNQRKYLKRFYYILQFARMCKHVFNPKTYWILFWFNAKEHIIMGL